MSANGSRLEALTRDLLAQWEVTKDSWKDVKCQEFEQRYMEELRTSVDSAVAVIAHLGRIISQTRSECE